MVKTLVEDQEENEDHRGRGREECGVDVRLKIGAKSWLHVVILSIKQQNNNQLMYTLPHFKTNVPYKKECNTRRESKNKYVVNMGQEI